ncbi:MULTISPECIES: flagella biosynthesis regulatory protein FliT [Bacillus]|uniref:flagella biosynthesis regulatory protein FliT n=1 Tax=Bacillus TaxID=1386 RepID=UPI00061DCC68|nr:MULTISPECIES: flagella biosynthesis regulatory protein FliT [Bacillus]AKE25338.1 flagellar assembly protein FliT involved in control of flagella expression [Bacillus sp. LM 4-2]QAR94382.1 flagella biosynthesis regulatory protein FliT [Bacillus subtilis]WFO99000.1 flagella biosynthesis regulatory protein FliT [Bacillus subtilis]WNW99625.1 flagella biosynthesis regulatory protein FliT [Bacillus sp. TSA-4]
MNNIDQLYTETKSMLSHIQNTPESDELLKQIEDFVATRSELIQEISLPLSEEERKQMKLILTWDQLIVKEMERLKQSIATELQQIKRKRVMHTTYLNPYNNITIDGTYYDKRK